MGKAPYRALRYSIVAAVLVLWSLDGMAEEGLPTIDELDAGWHQLMPGGDTSCFDGGDYGFFVKPADPDNLMVIFGSGGACWEFDTCTNDRRVTPHEKTIAPHDSPAAFKGIFDRDHEANPVSDYTIVNVGYCTADFHLGNGQREYASDDGREVIVNHNGYQNAASVMDWMFANVKMPESVVIAGWGGGATAASAWTSVIANNYADSKVAYLGDSPYLLGEHVTTLFKAWGADSVLATSEFFGPLSLDAVTVEGFIAAAARNHPNLRVGLVHTADDNTLKGVHGIFGVEGEVLDVLNDRHAAIRETGADITTFIAGGQSHCAIPGYYDWRPVEPSSNDNRGFPFVFDRFYSYQADGVHLADWISELIHGDELPASRQCSQCDTAQLDREDAVVFYNTAP